MAENSTLDDLGEQIPLMEPLLIREGSKDLLDLTDLALELAQKSGSLRAAIPAPLAASVSDLVRSMNCYYSNLIEGHDTHPIDIERALAGDYSNDPRSRDLQLEAKAHIEVQAWIDAGGLDGRACTANAVLETHARFCQALPEHLLELDHRTSSKVQKVVPGAYRTSQVVVGRHLPVSSGAIPRFMERFEAAYTGLGKTHSIIGIPAAHHRLLWIHPFLDGNGRVARLISYAMLRDALDTGGLWSVARGLARREGEYKNLLSCDHPRKGDLDGRGLLSEAALIEFTKFFLGVCIDQVEFMSSLMSPSGLRDRILIWVEEEMRARRLPAKSDRVISAVLANGGTLGRGELPDLLGMTPRHARRIGNELINRKVLASDSSRKPYRIAFPSEHASRWMPGLFPEKRDR